LPRHSPRFAYASRGKNREFNAAVEGGLVEVSLKFGVEKLESRRYQLLKNLDVIFSRRDGQTDEQIDRQRRQRTGRAMHSVARQ